MGLETIIKILIWLFLYSILGNYINYFLYYMGYIYKFVYSGLYYMLSVLGLSPLWEAVLYTAFFMPLLLFVINLVKKFLYN